MTDNQIMTPMRGRVEYYMVYTTLGIAAVLALMLGAFAALAHFRPGEPPRFAASAILFAAFAARGFLPGKPYRPAEDREETPAPLRDVFAYVAVLLAFAAPVYLALLQVPSVAVGPAFVLTCLALAPFQLVLYRLSPAFRRWSRSARNGNCR